MPAPLSPELREQLILEHLPQLKRIARKIHERLPVSIPLEDLISAGVLGLVTAVDRYESSSDIKLKTYAEFKIRGAILDSLQSTDWSTRQQLTRAKLIEFAISSLEEQDPTSNEQAIAAQLHLSVEEYLEWLSGVGASHSASMASADLEGNRHNLLLASVSPSEQQYAKVTEPAEMDQRLAVAIDNLPHLEKTVLQNYFLDAMTIPEIAANTGLDDLRISRLKSQAVLRLRSRLSNEHKAGASTANQASPRRPCAAPKNSAAGEMPGENNAEWDRLNEADPADYARSLVEDPVIQTLMAAASMFQKFEIGKSWLLTPSPSLDNVSPVSLILTAVGREKIANELGLIENGMF